MSEIHLRVYIWWLRLRRWWAERQLAKLNAELDILVDRFFEEMR